MAQSTFDRRRINGPEESFSPQFVSEDEDPLVSGKIRRARGQTDIRPIFLQPGLVNQANGSSYIETERAKIACAIYGPRQSKVTAFSERGRLNVEVKFTPFSCSIRRAPMHDAEDRTIAMAIHQAIMPSVRLELLPKSTIDIFITVIEADGIEACIASGSVAASTALADAGIEIFGLVTSCSACVISNDIWLDPTEAESLVASGTFVLSCMPALGTITSLWQSGQMQPDKAIACMELCEQRCVDIHSVMAQAILENRNSSSSL